MGIGGARVAELRKQRGITQVALARRAGISVSLLSKIEIGDRALTPGIAATLARALQISLGALYGEAEVPGDQSVLLEDLRTAVRRYDIPAQTPVPDPAQLRSDLDHATTMRAQTDLAGLLRVLPGLLTRATTYAHAAASPQGWALLADVYNVTYWLAARHRWMDLVELAPTRQAWAAAQRPNLLVTAVGVQDRAGAFLNCGDFESGLTVVDRAIVTAEAALSGPGKAFATGLLHLRGMTLAGQRGDRTEAQRHIRNPREVIRLAGELSRHGTGLPPAQIGAVNTARAQLEVDDRDGVQTSLLTAWAIAPQLAKVHPMCREVLRVLISAAGPDFAPPAQQPSTCRTGQASRDGKRPPGATGGLGSGSVRTNRRASLHETCGRPR